ncbi:MAG: sensor histidine kinase [Chitinophagales bacterium]|nr:sensor histidine kinase [Chitinophagales bacterium]MDW8428288.1 sensor histidine kinase [Chitinophagales bacterium]
MSTIRFSRAVGKICAQQKNRYAITAYPAHSEKYHAFHDQPGGFFLNRPVGGTKKSIRAPIRQPERPADARQRHARNCSWGTAGQYLLHRGEQVCSASHLLKNILLNLLSNALKFTPIQGCGHVYPRVAEATIQISVKDDGINIPEKDSPHQGNRFFRKNIALHIKSTALNLHMVQKYLKLLNGKLSLISNPEVGSESRITMSKEEREKDATH